MSTRTFIIVSFDGTTCTGVARSVQTNELFSFDLASLKQEMDGVAFVGEYIRGDIDGNRITNIAAEEES